MKWFFLLALAALITFGILNKEKLPFLNKEEPLDKSSAPITENDNDVETNNNEPENIDKNEPGIEMKSWMDCPHCLETSEVRLPMGASFFWPDAE